jgi:hypothetical protein
MLLLLYQTVCTGTAVKPVWDEAVRKGYKSHEMNGRLYSIFYIQHLLWMTPAG